MFRLYQGDYSTGSAEAFLLFGADCEYVIPFECIVNVGPDVILVNVCPEKIVVKL